LNKAEELETQRRLGAGFGDVESNRLVERAAVRAAKRNYEASGWRVQSVETKKVGFDLLCRKARQQLHVEVKGVSGRGSGFILTGGEYQKAASDKRYELCLVESALSAPTITNFAGGEMFGAFEFVPLAYKATRTPGSRNA
jgi:hypothetical protein